MLRKERVLEPSPFRDRSRSSVAGKRPPKREAVKSLKKSSCLSMSLPNLADIDDLGNLSSSRQPVYIPVYVG